MLLEAKSAQTFLSEELGRRIKNNSRYSQRAFARQMGLSPGELSEILRGKRKLSLRSALRITASMGLNPTETKHLLYLVQLDRTRDLKGNVPDPELEKDLETGPNQQLSMDMFHVVSDWYCFAIINLADCEDFRWNARWISRRLGIPHAEVNVALQRIERVGLIERVNGRLQVCQDYVLSPAGIPSEAIRNYHKQILEKAAKALDLQSVDEREMSGLSFALDPKHLPSIKKDISDFQDQLVSKYSKAKGRKSEVYHLESALFRITEASHSKEKNR